MKNNLFSLSSFKFDYDRDVLGNGQHGYVYKAFSPQYNQYFALKITNLNNKNSNISKVQREYEIMLNVEHPNIEKTFGTFIVNNCQYFVLEFIDGENLDKLIKKYRDKKENIDQNLIMNIFLGTENGLKYLHNKGIIHRDIAPDNIMIDKNNNVKITDFGLAAYYVKNENIPNNLVYSCSVVGRRFFVGSELFKRMCSGDKSITYDIKNDIFAFGVTMYILMTFGYPAYLKERIKNNTNIKFVEEIDENIYSKNLINLVKKMINDDPDKRPGCLDIHNELINIRKTNSAFNSVINCLTNFDFLNYLIEKEINLKNSKLERKEYEFNKVFVQTMIETKKLGSSSSTHINKFINSFYKKISIYSPDDVLNPINIIKSIFEYYLTNSPYLYNNKKAHVFMNKENKYKDNIIILNKISEFEKCYKNIFVEGFYFLELITYKCQKCNNEISENLEINNNIHIVKGDNKIYEISNLINDFFSKKIALNLGINGNEHSLVCNKCGIMDKYLDKYTKIILEPDILIFSFHSFVKLETNIEIMVDNNCKKFELNCFIVYNVKEKVYEYCIRIKDDWLYFGKEGSKTLNFENIKKLNWINTAFYTLDKNNKENENEFSIFK